MGGWQEVSSGTVLIICVAYYAIFSVILNRLRFDKLFNFCPVLSIYEQNNARKLVFVPLLTMAADLLENFTTAYLAWQFDGRASPISRVAVVFTATKSVLFFVSLLLILGGAIADLWHPHKPTG